MQIKVVHRDFDEYNPKLSNTKHSVSSNVKRFCRNVDPKLHPLEKARELQRAVVSAKMERMFSKPLISVLDNHSDSVCCMSRSRRNISNFLTGSNDGEIRLWNVSLQTCLGSLLAHKTGFLQGISLNYNDSHFFSCGNDGYIKQWSLRQIQNDNTFLNFDDKESFFTTNEHDSNFANTTQKNIVPIHQWSVKTPLKSIECHYYKDFFVTASDTIDIWDNHRSLPLHSFDWNQASDAVLGARFHPSENELIAAFGRDNVVGLIDLRVSSIIKKVALKSRSNGLCWNPTKPINFVVANEDHNLYTFDVRHLERALIVHKDFTNAVLDVDYCPTGHEFAAGSYDKTVRIFLENEGRSRETYHGRRMQIVHCCRYTADGRFILSGSADFCVRIWKAKAWESLGSKTLREKRALAYREALKQRYKYVPEVGRILRHRHIPKHVRKAAELYRTMNQASKRKELNVALHSGKATNQSEKEKVVKQVLE